MIQKWKEATTANKVVLILQVVVSISIMVLALLQLLDISNTINIFIPLLGVNTLLQAIQEWSKNRGTAIFSLCTAIFIFIVSFVA